MSRTAFAALLLSATMCAPALAAPGLAAPSLAATLDQTDQQFLQYAAHDNQGEIRICLTAEKKAQDPAVKAFARLMVNDHVQVESELAAAVDGNGASLPDDIGEDSRKTLSRLEPLEGAAFDRAFIAAQIEDHGHDIQRFTQEQQDAKDQAVQHFAALTIPVLQQHLALAKAVQAQVQGGQGQQTRP